MPLAGGDAYRCIPYALLYLERVLRDLNVEVILIDENIGDDFRPVIEKHQKNIILAGVSAMLGYQIAGGVKFSKFAKKLNPDIKIVWGGWHPTMMPEQTLSEDYIDYVVTGQGEKPFRELVLALINNSGLENISGLLYKNGQRIIKNSKGDFVSTEIFPDVNYDLIDLNKYILKGIPYAKRTVVYFASHGCPHKCSFCALTPVYNQKWYPKSLNKIISDFKHFIKTANIDSICFHDDNFFTNKSFSIALARAMIDSKLNLKWEVWSHAGSFMKMFSDEDIQLFYKAGLRRILFGAESGSNEVLKKINKDQSVEENLNFTKLLKKHKITPYFTTMICFPMNPDEDIKATFDMIRKARLVDLSLKVHVGYYTPFPNTLFYQNAVEKGFVPPAKLEGWINHTFETFRAPWFKNEFENIYKVFINFYLTLSNPFFFNNASRPRKQKIGLAILNWLVFPFAYIRMKTNFFKLPVGARLFFFFTDLYRSKTGKLFMIFPH
ncbi:MAG: (Dimethylallyl)adenosine tRNA methylthiotransferase MiaB [Bacteroidetes bacterium ADurb.Bin408]|nr:MAG: (Dimethylallyl)adenosine tRNA methylthiotransferase MiaB [Bacteroidetes bacterium ADurb.Bin408]